MPELDRLVATRADQLGAMAASWIAAGASAVELWSTQGLTARWAPDLELGSALSAGTPARTRTASGSRRTPRGGGVHAPIVAGDTQLGVLRLVGVNGGVTRRRLAADATTLGSLLAHEADLATLTDALVESQDQLLGIMSLLGVVHPAEGPGALAAAVAAHARTLLGVPVTAVALPVGGGWEAAVEPIPATATVLDLLGSLALDPAAHDALGLVTPDGWLVTRTQGRPGRTPLLLAQADPVRPWSSPALRLATAIAELTTTLVVQADHVAEVLERQRLERQLAFAGEVQRLLLSRPIPALEGVEVATRYRPAGSVGGDFFAVKAVGERTIVALGDVSGKGAPAALLMATCRAVFETFAADVTGPAALLDRMAAVLSEDLTAATAFMTLCVAVLDPRRGELRIANAGHCPVLLRTSAGVRLLAPEEPPIGVIDDLTHTELTVPFGPGDLLLLASDGITEREDTARGLFGLERLIDHLAVADGAPERIADRLLADVDRFADARPRGDDETLLVARGTCS